MRVQARLENVQRVEEATRGSLPDGRPQIREGFRLRFQAAGAPPLFGEFDGATFEFRTDKRADLEGLVVGQTYEIEVKPLAA